MQNVINIVWSDFFCQCQIFWSMEGVHLTLPPHIISIQVKSRSMLHHGSVGASLNEIKET